MKWNTFTVQELIELGYIEPPMDGNHGSLHPKTSDYVEEGIPFLMVNDMKDGEIDFENCAFISEKQAHTLRKGFAKPGDVLLSHKATIGRTAIVPSEYDTIVLTPQITYYRVKKGINNRYLKYYFDSPVFQGTFENWANSGSTRAYLGITAQHNLPIQFPDLMNQEKIASILGALDEKIVFNKKINKNLLQQLHVLYLRLFCDSAMDTPLGDVVATTSGGTPSRKHDEYYSDSSICWVKSKELIGNYIHETEEHINDLAIKKSSAKLLPEHSVLIAMYGATVGAYGVISKPMTCNQAVCALLCNENYPYTYLFQIAFESQQKFINLAVGSAQQNISQVLIKQLNLHSDLDIIQRFHDLALPMHQEIEFLQAENIRLSDLRDNLLPKLMSGELDVSNVEI